MKEEYENLLHRIVEGAKYIQSIGEDHPKFGAAMNRYDYLYERAGEIQKRLRGGA